eukprot:CAMPEP_0118699036 /NCGR_PEP_ID=MMETSP0800-20121206/15614_1 /TAXON_ID=210618 ORGANISM="Striatella unipunctata, Strain CCMP2910" /NCGR_SAMPLE_ID=MMETSP0800 /ASSEMBLY_ACC=CAM_ASM_000638 /LENGTH=514 /DNA_ID=CAMNT_0006599085 /DNA_START=68 /DNA_END=1612 /DNA_ORIENTATION=-
MTTTTRLLSIALALGAPLQSLAKTPDNVSSRLMIQIPKALYKEDGYDHREALFGMPHYGGAIAQQLYYADSDLCDPNVDTTKGYPARSGKDSWPSPFILMVDRGGCTFVKKVRNAQRAGAAGVIIADNTCLCNDQDCIAKSGSPTCETAEPIMADDGSGSDISIPSFLMFKTDADAVKEEVKKGQFVQLEMKWALPNYDDRVEYSLWFTPTDVVSREFLRNFKQVAQALGDKAYFTPHLYIYDGLKSNCLGNDGSNMCSNLCTNNGRYCATDPDNDLTRGISGADVVKESLRRLCIWKQHGEQDGVGAEWWDYVTWFMDRCNNANYFMNEDCIKDAYKHSRVDGDRVDSCMKDSGGLTGDNSNAFLDLEINAQTERGVVVLPTAFVNTAALRGSLTVANIFDAICAGFMEGTAPKICNVCTKCPDVEGCARSGVCKLMPASSSGGVSGGTFAMTVLVLAGVFAGAAFWHWKKTRDDMRNEVRGILAEYMPLDEGEKEGGSPMDFARRAGTTSLI